MLQTIRPRFQGANTHRYRQNPLEKAFAAAWQDMNSGPNNGRTTLDYLMDVSGRGTPEEPISDRDLYVANTLIQWLGSPVGQSFLVNVLCDKSADYVRECLKREPT